MILAHLENRPMTPTAVLQARLARGWPRGWARSEQKKGPSGDGEPVGALLIFLGTKKTSSESQDTRAPGAKHLSLNLSSSDSDELEFQT